MGIDLWSPPAPFQPVPLTRSLEHELLAAVDKGSAALEDYNRWRDAQALPRSEGPQIFLCFIIAHAQPDARELVLRWLDGANYSEPPN